MLMPSLGLTTRFVAALVGAVVFAGAAALGLWSHDQAQRRTAALNDHARLILHDLTASLETRLALGLPLARLPDIDRLLETARRGLPGLGALAVVDESGRALFSTDPVEIGEPVLDPMWLSSQEGRRTGGEEDFFWHQVITDYGAIAGATVLRLSAGATDASVMEFALSRFVAAAPWLAALIVLAAVLGFWQAQRVGHPAAETAALLEHWAREPLDPDQGAGDLTAGAVDLPLAEFAQAISSRHLRLAAAEAELRRLDEMA